MKRKLFLIPLLIVLSGCVAIPVYDDAYNYPSYGTYPYGYVGPNVNLFLSGGYYRHGGHDGGSHYRGGGSHHYGGRHHRGGGHWGGGRH